MSLDRHIGTRLRRLRLERGEKPEKIAIILSVSPKRYTAFEAGQDHLSVSHLIDLCTYLDVPVTYFFDGYEGIDEQKNPRSKDGTY